MTDGQPHATANPPDDATQRLPDAPLSGRERLGFAWIVPALAAVLAVALGWSYWQQRGAVVEVSFAQAHGLEAGSDVRFRGTSIGEVESVTLDGGGILARLRLRDDALHLARTGSGWWIPRPRVSLAGVEGLETLLGASYVTVRPGPEGAEPRRRFAGLDEAPVDVPWRDGLELTLESSRLGGLAAGAPVRFRQIDVGRIRSVELASDGGSVLVKATIAPEYAELVRSNTRFWNASGVSIEAGILRGLDFSLDSLEALLTGAVAFATPPDATGPVRDGARFALAERAEPEWSEWVAQLPVGTDALGANEPHPRRALLTWERERLIGTADEERTGWLVRLEEGWLGPRNLLEVPDRAIAGSARLVVDGARVELATDAAATPNLRTVPAPRDASGWSPHDVRAPLEPENCLVHGADVDGARAIDRTRLVSDEGAVWRFVDDGVLGPHWHGAPVTARRDGALIGIVVADEDGIHIAVDVPLPR